MTPQQIRVALEAAIVAVLMATTFAAGFCVQGWRKDAEIAGMQASWEQLVKSADQARADAEKRAGLAESTERDYYSKALVAYKESHEQEHETAVRTIADLRAGNERLRVSTTNSASRSCPLPGAAAGTGGSDAPGEETLSPAVAARLAGRYADYNELVDRLTLCQSVVKARQPAPQ